MLGGLFGSYVFPRLKWVEEVKLHKDRDGRTNIYELDWSKHDEIASDCGKTSNQDFALPPHWRKIIEGPFAITPEYFKGIAHFSQLATLEKVPKWNFDTMIREICLEPATAAANTAFKLLSDCSFDTETGFYDRSKNRKVREYAMRYYFWLLQTGTGLVKDCFGFDKMGWWAWHWEQEGNKKEKEAAAQLRGFSLMADYQINGLIEGSKPCEGPSIEPKEPVTGFDYDCVIDIDASNPCQFAFTDGGKPTALLDKDPAMDFQIYDEDKLNTTGTGSAKKVAIPLFPVEMRFDKDDKWGSVKCVLGGHTLYGYFRPYYDDALNEALEEKGTDLEIAKDICVPKEDIILGENGTSYARVRVDKNIKFDVWHYHKATGEKRFTTSTGLETINVPMYMKAPKDGRWIRVSLEGEGTYSPGIFGYFKPYNQKMDMFLDSL